MEYNTLFTNLTDAVGSTVSAPNIVAVDESDKVLIIPPLATDSVRLVENKKKDFVTYQLLQGAFLLTVDGRLLHSSSKKLKDTYDPNEVTGIVVSSDRNTLLFPATTPKIVYFCGGGVLCPDATAYSSAGVAISQGLSGEEETAIFRNNLKGTDWAVNVTYNTILNGKHCWLPSMAELQDIYRYCADVLSLWKRCGVTLNSNISFWSSSLNNRVEATNALYFMYGYKPMTPDKGIDDYWGLDVQGLYYALPVTSYTL